jgi:hypothetical protein
MKIIVAQSGVVGLVLGQFILEATLSGITKLACRRLQRGIREIAADGEACGSL